MRSLLEEVNLLGHILPRNEHLDATSLFRRVSDAERPQTTAGATGEVNRLRERMNRRTRISDVFNFHRKPDISERQKALTAQVENAQRLPARIQKELGQGDSKPFQMVAPNKLSSEARGRISEDPAPSPPVSSLGQEQGLLEVFVPLGA